MCGFGLCFIELSVVCNCTKDLDYPWLRSFSQINVLSAFCSGVWCGDLCFSSVALSLLRFHSLLFFVLFAVLPLSWCRVVFSIILRFQLKAFLVIFLLWILNLQVAILVIQRLIDGTEIRMRTMALTALKLLLQRMFLLGKFRKISHGLVLLGIANSVWSTTNLSAGGESPSRYAHSLLIFMIFLLSRYAHYKSFFYLCSLLFVMYNNYSSNLSWKSDIKLTPWKKMPVLIIIWTVPLDRNG